MSASLPSEELPRRQSTQDTVLEVRRHMPEQDREWPWETTEQLCEKLKTRFWQKVNIAGPDDCWLWTAGTIQGYGSFSVGGRAGRMQPAHRISWRLTRGAIPNGLFVLHRCDVPACVNPAHLFLGTPADNTHDMVKKGRAPTGERSGAYRHPERIPRGESHCRAKLSDECIAQIRSSTDSQSLLAARFGVNQGTISKIKAFKRRVPFPYTKPTTQTTNT